MEETLDALCQAPGIQGAMVVGKDGLMIAASGDVGGEPDLLGATAAELFSLAESAGVERLGRGTVGTLTLEMPGGPMFVRALDEVTFLLVLAEDRLTLGMARYELRRAAEKLREQS